MKTANMNMYEKEARGNFSAFLVVIEESYPVSSIDLRNVEVQHYII